MIIGIISDTHDNVENIKKAIKLFLEQKVDFVVHCGDVVAPATIKHFKGIKLKLVKGNCDGDIENIKLKIEEIDGEYLGEVGIIDIDNKSKLLAYHGNDRKRLDSFIKNCRYQYILTGHTHVSMDEIIGSTRVLNPGAHYYGGQETVMILDTKTNKVNMVKL